MSRASQSVRDLSIKFSRSKSSHQITDFRFAHLVQIKPSKSNLKFNFFVHPFIDYNLRFNSPILFYVAVIISNQQNLNKPTAFSLPQWKKKKSHKKQEIRVSNRTNNAIPVAIKFLPWHSVMLLSRHSWPSTSIKGISLFTLLVTYLRCREQGLNHTSDKSLAIVTINPQITKEL